MASTNAFLPQRSLHNYDHMNIDFMAGLHEAHTILQLPNRLCLDFGWSGISKSFPASCNVPISLSALSLQIVALLPNWITIIGPINEANSKRPPNAPAEEIEDQRGLDEEQNKGQKAEHNCSGEGSILRRTLVFHRSYPLSKAYAGLILVVDMPKLSVNWQPQH